MSSLESKKRKLSEYDGTAHSSQDFDNALNVLKTVHSSQDVDNALNVLLWT